MSGVAMQVDSAHDFSWKSKSAPRYKFRQVTQEGSADPKLQDTAVTDVTFRFGRSWVVNLAKTRLQFSIREGAQGASNFGYTHIQAPILAGYSLQTETGVMLQQVDTYAQGIYKALMPTSIMRDEFDNYPGLSEPMLGSVAGNCTAATNLQPAGATATSNSAALDYVQQRALSLPAAADTVGTTKVFDIAFYDLFPPSVLNVPVDHYPGMDYVLKLSFSSIAGCMFYTTSATALTGAHAPVLTAPTGLGFISNPVLQVACLDDAAQALAIKELCLTQGIQIPCPRIFIDVAANSTAGLYSRQYKFNISHGQRLLRVATTCYPGNANSLCFCFSNVAGQQWTNFRDYLGQIPLMDQALSPSEVHSQLIKPLFEKTLHGKRSVWDQSASIIRDFTGGWDLINGCPAAGVDLSLPLDYQVELTKTDVPTSVLVVWLGQNVFRVNPTGITLLPA
jgi:hypothetical protein